MNDSTTHNETIPTHAFDIVCGMEVPITTKMIRTTYEDETYYFCSLNCKEHFDNAPERYVAS